MTPKSNMAAILDCGIGQFFFTDSETWGPNLASCKKEKIVIEMNNLWAVYIHLFYQRWLYCPAVAILDFRF